MNSRTLCRLYCRCNLSRRDTEDLLAKRGIVVGYESIRLWSNKFGPRSARRLRRTHQGYGGTLFIDEVFVKIQGKQQYLLWRAVDQDGEVVDVHVAVYNLFNPGRHLICARHYRELRHTAFASWEKAVAA